MICEGGCRCSMSACAHLRRRGCSTPPTLPPTHSPLPYRLRVCTEKKQILFFLLPGGYSLDLASQKKISWVVAQPFFMGCPPHTWCAAPPPAPPSHHAKAIHLLRKWTSKAGGEPGGATSLIFFFFIIFILLLKNIKRGGGTY
uniref:Uncharacterized protein n=1 Tax=Morchella brunnea TaxID=1174671 RepID=A0A8K1I833_9PEZI|nr:hypothetical protein LK370_mgp111 [Morchella brunnea]UBU98549.1 hypothetical protein [Morchella brunnea]